MERFEIKQKVSVHFILNILIFYKAYEVYLGKAIALLVDHSLFFLFELGAGVYAIITDCTLCPEVYIDHWCSIFLWIQN